MKEQRPLVSYTNLLFKFGGLLVLGLLFVSPTIACGSSSEASCTGTVNYLGEPFTGEGANVEEAQHNACNRYCLEADPEFDVYYYIWLDSPKGVAAGSPPKNEAIYKDKDLLNYVVDTCANRCIADVKDGKLEGGATCP